MSLRIELSGKRFGTWTIVSYAGLNKNKHPSWNCLCDCGVERVVVGQTLRNGTSVGCGCTRNAVIAKKKTKHGQTGRGFRWQSRTYKSWAAMRHRCSPTATGTASASYRKNGTTVCGRWTDFKNFLSDMGECPDGLSLDRIDVFGNYEPGNCRWADSKTQANNKRERVIAKHFADFNERALAAVCMVV